MKGKKLTSSLSSKKNITLFVGAVVLMLLMFGTIGLLCKELNLNVKASEEETGKITEDISYVIEDDTIILMGLKNDTVINAFDNADCIVEIINKYGIKKVIANENIKGIGSFAFVGCESIEEVVLHGATSIEKKAFYFCSSLKSVDASHCMVFGKKAFCNCYNLSDLYLGEYSSDFSMNDDIFEGSNANIKIHVQYYWREYFKEYFNKRTFGANSIEFVDVVIPGSDIKYSVNGETLTLIGTGNSKIPRAKHIRNTVISELVQYLIEDNNVSKLIIGDGIKSIEEYSFNNCDSLKEVIISDSVTDVDEGAFCTCRYLEKVSIGKGLTQISRLMFYSCFRLENVEIPDNIQKICVGAFSACFELKTIKISQHVKIIEDEAFCQCEALEEITFEGSMPSFGEHVFVCVGENKNATKFNVPIDDESWVKIINKEENGILKFNCGVFDCNLKKLMEQTFIGELKMMIY